MVTKNQTSQREPIDRGEAVVQFCQRALVHVQGDLAGQPFTLQPWQRRIVRDLFGTVDGDGRRRYREALIAVPRKNGKSTLGAALALAALCLDGEQGAQIFSAAAEKDQARLVFSIAKAMVGRSQLLSEMLQVYGDAIVNPDVHGVYKPISAEAYSKHGLNPHLVIFDELHAQKTPDLYDVLRTGMGARSQPLMVSITTAGYARDSVCRKVWDYASAVSEGMIHDDAFYAAVWETAPAADWTDPDQWAAANPNLGVSVSREFLERECEKAKRDTAYENTFRQLYLNQWTEQSVRYIPMRDWDATASIPLPDLDGQPCFIGIDLSNTVDLTAWVAAFPLASLPGDDDAETPAVALVPRVYIPAERMEERERRDRVPYRAWVKDGIVTATPGNSVDYETVMADIMAAADTYDVKGVGIDPWNSTHMQQRLLGEGVPVVAYRQGFKSFADPTKQLQRLTLEHRIIHAGSAPLRWNMSNLVVRLDEAGNVKPDKARAAEKIDIAVAAIMAIGLWQAETLAARNHYDSNDLVEFQW